MRAKLTPQFLSILSASMLVLLSLSAGSYAVQAQETGPLMMNVEVGFTLGGAVAGAGIGFVVWMTDPLGPVSIQENVRNGLVLGTVLGAILGYYVLFNAVIIPGLPGPNEPSQELQNLLGADLAPPDIVALKPYTHQTQALSVRGMSFNILHYRF